MEPTKLWGRGTNVILKLGVVQNHKKLHEVRCGNETGNSETPSYTKATEGIWDLNLTSFGNNRHLIHSNNAYLGLIMPLKQPQDKDSQSYRRRKDVPLRLVCHGS